MFPFSYFPSFHNPKLGNIHGPIFPISYKDCVSCSLFSSYSIFWISLQAYSWFPNYPLGSPVTSSTSYTMMMMAGTWRPYWYLGYVVLVLVQTKDPVLWCRVLVQTRSNVWSAVFMLLWLSVLLQYCCMAVGSLSCDNYPNMPSSVAAWQ